MVVYRISTREHINDLNGNGARLYGGRWNQKGTSVVYTSETRALASIEYLVHITFPLIPDDLCIASITIKETITPQKINFSSLPPNWKNYPAPIRLAEIGSNWVADNSSLLLQVPSVLVENEYNILINPNHPDSKHVKIKDIKNFTYDKRILK